MVVNQSAGKVKKFGLVTALTAAATLVGATYATSALADGPMLTKAPLAPAAAASCGSFYDFFFSACPLTWYGVTVYGTVDAGGGYETHGAPFNPQQPAGQAYFLQKVNRPQGMFGLAPNGLSQSNIGVKITEPIGGGWNFVSQLEFGFDPYSLQAANGPGSVFNNRGIPLAAQSTNGDSSRAGQFYNSVGYLGVSSSTFGTLTFFRQNALTLDGVIAYDPMGASYAFSPIGWSGQTCGDGDTEDCRISTAAKYRVNIGPIRLAALAQIGGYGQNNGSNADYEAQIGGDIANLGGGVLSLDGIYSWVKDAVGVAAASPVAPNPMIASITNNQSFMALAKYHNGPFNLYGGFEWMTYANPSDPQTAFTDIGGNFVCLACANNTTISNAVTTSGVKTVYIAWTGVKYAVTKNLDVIGAYYHYTQPQFAATGASVCTTGAQAGCYGTMDAYSAVIDWRFFPKWDAYFGFMFSQVNGGLATGYQVRNNFDPTVGVRFRF